MTCAQVAQSSNCGRAARPTGAMFDSIARVRPRATPGERRVGRCLRASANGPVFSVPYSTREVAASSNPRPIQQLLARVCRHGCAVHLLMGGTWPSAC